MDIATIREIVKNVTYKPRWRFDVDHAIALSGYALTCRTKVADVDNPNKEIVISLTHHIRFDADEKEVLYCIHHVTRTLEEHEMCEWLRYKGEFIRKPHPLDG